MNLLRSLKSSSSPVKSPRLRPQKLKERIAELAAANRLRFQTLFSDEYVNDLASELGHVFRERAFDPGTTIDLYVSQVLNRDEPCSAVVSRLNKERKDKGLDPVSANASAYCYARKRLPLDLIESLTDKMVAITNDRCHKSWKWLDHDVLLVDGFTVRAPDTDANQAVFPQPTSQEPGLGYPTIRVVTLTSLATKVVRHFQYGPMDGKGNGERSLFRKTFAFLRENQVIVGDSIFDSYYDIAALLDRKAHCVLGINGTRDNPFLGTDVPAFGEIVRVLKRPSYEPNRITREAWERLPETITVRIIAFRVTGRSEQKVIVTTLHDPKKYPAEEIAELYGLRWEVELDIRCIKSEMNMSDLRGQTPEALHRELAIHVLAYNLVALLVCDVAEVAEKHPRQISFSHARDTVLHFGAERVTVSDCAWIILQAVQFLTKNRRRREEPRAIKKRRSKYPILKVPRPSKKAKLDRAAP